MSAPPIPPEQAKKMLPKLDAKEKLLKDLTEKLEESKTLQEKSLQLRKKADETADSEEAEKLRREAWEHEQRAKKLIRTAQRMQNGVFQGGAAGAGIGAGIAGGLGTLVGALVGGVVAIPTTTLGILAGAGTGAIHGPWVKLVQDTVKEDEEAQEKGEELEVESMDIELVDSEPRETEPEKTGPRETEPDKTETRETETKETETKGN